MENEIGYNMTVSQGRELGMSLEKQLGCSLYVRGEAGQEGKKRRQTKKSEKAGINLFLPRTFL